MPFSISADLMKRLTDAKAAAAAGGLENMDAEEEVGRLTAEVKAEAAQAVVAEAATQEEVDAALKEAGIQRGGGRRRRRRSSKQRKSRKGRKSTKRGKRGKRGTRSKRTKRR